MNDNEERVELPCPHCHGKGWLLDEFTERPEPCHHCFGEGWIQ